MAALERLYVATGRFADLLAIYDKKLELAKSKAEALEIRFSSPRSTRKRSSSPTRRSSSTSRSSPRIREQLPALPALDRIYQQLGRWNDLSDDLQEIVLSTDVAAVVELKFRRGRSSTHSRLAGAFASTARRSSRPDARGRAHGAAGVPVEQRRRLQRAAVDTLEPIYEATNDCSPGRGPAY